MTNITLTPEQLDHIEKQEAGGSEPEMPTNPVMMEIDFGEIWHGREIETPRENYSNRTFLCTDVDGYSIACKMPDVIDKSFRLRIVDVQNSTAIGRAVVWSRSRDFDEGNFLGKVGIGGTSANGDVVVTTKFAGQTIYYNSTSSTGTPEVPYEVKVQGYSY